MITLVLGGARSGKSDFAERLVTAQAAQAGQLVYIATGEGSDPDMEQRIARHRQRRDDRFVTVEAGAELAGALRSAPPHPALVDALGTWVAAHPDFVVDIDELVGALRNRTVPTVVVSDEVGLGVHPETAIGVRFRDVLGTVNQRVAEIADEVVLVVAGRALPLLRPDELSSSTKA